ncbi:predicted protein [Naegleria gruberi]|uniref:Predicted protein n=1 Tax=Naegleria gruberi TaxID=5762 RepID=D2V8V8_NAEGR|nr:uncharacterized protein NAEGRDRAFT_65299 [Naegleria gruberi]EFC46868.1 predicted protein [Naegleria gruberi]|eukprot:XP_002679612.1 predicted protein [Naegleria gruberi strain NEG-M]
MSQNFLPHSLPKGVKRRLVGLSEQGIKNKQKRKNIRKNQWKEKDFILFGLQDSNNVETTHRSRRNTSIPMKRGDHDEDFAHLPWEIYFHICLFLDLNDRVVKKLLLISSEISCKMLGVSSLKEMEVEKVRSSPYYELLTFLAIRNEIERFSNYANGKEKFVNRKNDLVSTSKELKTKWNQLQYKEQVYFYYYAKKSEMKKQIRNPKSEFTASKVFFRLENSIRDLNKYFPHWLSSKEEFGDTTSMHSYIKQHRNVERLYETLLNVKKVGIPVVSFGDEEFEFFESLDMKLNSLLFDSNRLRLSKSKVRNWKLMFEKQMEKRLHLDFTEQVFKWTKFYLLNETSPKHSEKSLQIDCKPLEEMIRLATKMDEKNLFFHLFERNYAHGEFRLLKQTKNNPKLMTPRTNDFMSLYQHVLGRIMKRRALDLSKPNLEIFTNFTVFMIQKWKEFHMWKFPNSTLTEEEIFHMFLSDGPRKSFTNALLMFKAKIIDSVRAEFPQFEFNEQHVDDLLEEARPRSRKNGKFKDPNTERTKQPKGTMPRGITCSTYSYSGRGSGLPIRGGRGGLPIRGGRGGLSIRGGRGRGGYLQAIPVSTLQPVQTQQPGFVPQPFQN